MKEHIAIIGDGGWGTALALHACHTGHQVSLWSAFPEYAELLAKKRENVKFLPGFQLPKTLKIATNLPEIIAQHEIVVFAVPTQYLESVLSKIPLEILEEKILVNVAKGIEEHSLRMPHQIIASFAKKAALAVISGPSHAEEVAQKVPTCLVVASKHDECNVRLQQVFMTERLRVYTSNDVMGVSIGGALKNVIAIAAGMCDGLSYGSNTKAALLARGLNEIMRLGVKLGAKQETLFGLTGLGDLVTTCFSPYGRNRAVGERLGKGETMKAILSSMEMVAEGVKTAKAVHMLAEKQAVEMPICEEVFKVIYHSKLPEHALYDLMMRAPKAE